MGYGARMSNQTEDILPYDKTALAATRLPFEERMAELKGYVFAQEDRPLLVQNMNWAQGVLKSLEEERENLVRPLIDDKAKIDGVYRETRSPIEAFKAFCSEQEAKLELEAQAAQHAAREIARLAAASGDAEGCLAALAAVPEADKTAGSRTTMGWDFEIVDKEAVPEIYKTVDEKLIKASCKAFAKSEVPPNIPGIVFKRSAKVAPLGVRK